MGFRWNSWYEGNMLGMTYLLLWTAALQLTKEEKKIHNVLFDSYLFLYLKYPLNKSIFGFSSVALKKTTLLINKKCYFLTYNK